MRTPAAKVSANMFKAGETVTIEGTIDPGQELYVTVAEKKMFAPKDTNGVHEVKRLKKDAKKAKFELDTEIPPLFYLLTTNPDVFGKEGKKKFGGPSVLLGKGNGIYSTSMYYLKKKYDDIPQEAKAMLGPIQTEAQWNFLRYANESSYGINTIVKEGNNVGKVTIFSRTVISDHGKTGKYWDKGTSISLDKNTGKFTASFKTYRHTPPDTEFDVFINGAKSGGYTVKENGFWLTKGFRYMNPLWIIIGAILVGTYFSMIGAGRRHAHGGLPGADRPYRRSGGHQRRQRFEALQHGPDPVFHPWDPFTRYARGGKEGGMAYWDLVRRWYFHRLHLAGQICVRAFAHESLQGVAGGSGGPHGRPDPSGAVPQGHGKTEKTSRPW